MILRELGRWLFVVVSSCVEMDFACVWCVVFSPMLCALCCGAEVFDTAQYDCRRMKDVRERRCITKLT